MTAHTWDAESGVEVLQRNLWVERARTERVVPKPLLSARNTRDGQEMPQE